MRFFRQFLKLIYSIHYIVDDTGNAGGGNPSQSQDTPQDTPPPQALSTRSVSELYGGMTQAERELMRNTVYGQFTKEYTKKGKILDEDQVAISKEDHEKYQQILNEQEELKQKKMLEDGEFKKLLEKTQKEKEKAEAILREQIAEKEKEMALKTNELVQNNLDITVSNQLHQFQARDPNELLKIIRSNVRYKDNNINSEIEIIDNSGNVLMSEADKTKPMKLDEYIINLANTKPYHFNIEKLQSPSVGKSLRVGALTIEDIQNMPKEEFDKLDPAKL